MQYISAIMSTITVLLLLFHINFNETITKPNTFSNIKKCNNTKYKLLVLEIDQRASVLKLVGNNVLLNAKLKQLNAQRLEMENKQCGKK